MLSLAYLLGIGALLFPPSVSKPTDLFSGFFPCLPDTSNISTQEDAQSCDLFVYAAVQLALDKTKSSEEQSNRGQLKINTLETSNSDTITDVVYNLYVEISRSINKFSQSIELTRATILPDSLYIEGVPVVSFSQNIRVPMVSYGLTDSRFNSFPNFYRTVPSMDTINQARIKLLAFFDWSRIGILGSVQLDYQFQMESFSSYFSNFTERRLNAELSYEGTTEYLSSSLLDLHRFDIRIILGFFGPKESRLVLCEASSQKYNLTTPDHVWILPSYYNPDWWKVRQASYYNVQQTINCTDEEMLEILNSVIFLDPVKYPPMDISLSDFYSMLLKKTQELFSDLDPKVDLERLLPHSRAVSAYDSTLLLAHSLSHGEVNRTRLEQLITCEICRVYPKRFVPEMLKTRFFLCQSECKLELDYVTTARRVFQLQGYGQVLISQFINGTNCPMTLFWPSHSDVPENIRNNFVQVYELDRDESSRNLGLDPQLLFPNGAHCPQHFYWKGRSSAPVASHLRYSEVPVEAVVFMGLLVGVGEAIIIFLLIFTIIFRTTQHVKSTSPRINMLILVGAAITLPYSVLDEFIVSFQRYQLSHVAADLICQVSLWIPTLGLTLVGSGTLVKIYRLYKIFHNTSLKMKLKCVTDQDLIVMALVLTIPMFLILVVWTISSPWKYMSVLAENGSFQYVNVTLCSSKSLLLSNTFQLVVAAQLLFLLVCGLGMSLFLTRPTPSIKIDIQATRFSFLVGTFIALVAFSAELVTTSPLEYFFDWWARMFQFVVAPLFICCGLFLYQVVLVFRDHIKLNTKLAKNSQ